MKSAPFIFAAAVGLVPWPDCGARGAETVSELTRESLDRIVGGLDRPETRIAAMQQLIEMAGHQLYAVGSIALVSGDPERDRLQREAARAVDSQANPKTVAICLDHQDPELRFWGVMSFETRFGRKEPWRPLLPRLMELATTDENASIRREALSRLRSYTAGSEFLDGLQDSTEETDPGVLMMLFRFDTMKPSAAASRPRVSREVARGRWYARAVEILSGDDASLRRTWLTHIHSNVSNSATAEMWRIERDSGLVAQLETVKTGGLPGEKAQAEKILELFVAKSPDR